MKIGTQWFDTTAERRAFIKAERQQAKAQGNKFRILRCSYCRQRCTGKKMYFAEFVIE